MPGTGGGLAYPLDAAAAADNTSLTMDAFANAAATAKPDCPKCKGTGTYMYDHNHGTVCDLCCTH